MKKYVLALAMLTAFGSQKVFAQAKLVEEVKQKGDELVIPYKKYVYPNGLTLIVHEDHSDPIVHVDVTYHVGSAREEIGKSGFAHFFEHMMFQGSDNVADEQHFKIITEAGGTLNGTTNRDRTNYFETVPSNQLEKMLWLEADRMGFLLDAVTQKKFEVQRATVKNERGQNYDNVPYGLVSEVAAKNLYPYGHPYSWLTIGYIEDLNRVNVEDLKNFFLRWYGPNNAVLTVGGDVEAKEVTKLVDKYFGSIPRGPEVKPAKLPAPKLSQDRYVSMTDNYAKLPMLRMVYPGVPAYHKDEAPLDCLAEILGGGKNSIFYKNFIKQQKAVAAQVYNPSTELAGEFTITVVPYPGQKLSEMEDMVRAAFKEFEQRGVTDEDIEKFRNNMEADMIYGLETVSGKVSQLASFATFTGNPNYIGQNLKRYTTVTKEDVMRVYNQYVKNGHAVVLSVTPKNQETNIAAAANYTVSEAGYKAPDYGYTGLKYNKAKDNFDRSVVPGNGENPVVNVPDFWKAKLPSNVQVMGAESDELPVVNLIIEFEGGKLLDARQPSKAGLSSMFADMMEEDTKNYTAEQMSVELDKLGSSINFYSGTDGIGVSVRSLTKNLDRTMELLQERLLNPNFTEEAFSTVKKRTIESIKNSLDKPTVIASQVYDKVAFGATNVLSWPSNGTEETVANIKLEDIQAYYDELLSVNGAEVVVVGDVSKDRIVNELAFLNKMPSDKIILPTVAAAPKVEKTKIYFVDVPGAAQTEFRVGYVTDLKYDALGDYYKAGVMNYALGGAFNSRLNLDLREDKGWTYGARSFFTGNKYTGEYQFSSGIKADATDSALAVILNIVENYKKTGITAEELAFTKSSMGQSDARKYETGYQKAGFLGRIMEYDLPADYPTRQTAMLNAMGRDEANSLANKYLPNKDKMNIVLVGDKEKVMPGLQKFGYEIVELDKYGNPVSN